MKPNDQLTPFLGFAPDADPTTPGVLTDTTMMAASVRGLKSFPFTRRMDGPTGFPGYGAFSAYPQGYVEGMWCGLEPGQPTQGAVVVKTRRDSVNKVYSLRYVTTAAASACGFWQNWEDITPAATLVEGPAVFEKFGDYLLMAGGFVMQGVAYTNPLCVINGGYNCTAITGAPAAAVMTVATRFVLAFNYSATWGGFNDGWVCSARDNHTDWVPSTTTLCAYGRLVESDGPITAAIAFGDDVIVCKFDSMYMGRFNPNSAEVWEFEKISHTAGAQNQNCICRDREGRAYMLGIDDLYVWDGAQVRGLMGGVIRQWFIDNTNLPQSLSGVHAHINYDPIRELVVVAVPDVSATSMYVLTYCPRSKLWAKATTSYERLCIGPSGISAWPSRPGLFAMASSSSFSSANTTANRYLYEFSSAAPDGGQLCGVTTGDIGSDFYESELKTSRVRMVAGNVSYTHRRAWAMHRADMMGAFTTAVSGVTAKADCAFDTHQSDKWHRLRFEFSGNAEVTGMNLDINRQGAK